MFHIITQTIVVNALAFYKAVIEQIKINDFKIKIFVSILSNIEESTRNPLKHHLERAGPAQQTRKRCHGYYHSLSKESDSQTAVKKAKKINTRCSNCLLHFCLDCFNKRHKKCIN